MIEMKMPGYDCFIAHASADSSPARELYARLALRRTVFMSIQGHGPGPWDEAILKAQRASRATVVLLSANSRNDYYLLEEVAAAIELHRTNGHVVIPLLLEPLSGDQLPYGMLRMQHVNLKSSWDETARHVERLLEGGVPEQDTTCARIVFVDASGGSNEVTIAEGQSVVAGRAAGNLIVFGNAGVSTVHAELWLQRGVLRVRDCGSKNGTTRPASAWPRCSGYWRGCGATVDKAG